MHLCVFYNVQSKILSTRYGNWGMGSTAGKEGTGIGTE